jgi:hypothetical protein
VGQSAPRAERLPVDVTDARGPTAAVTGPPPEGFDFKAGVFGGSGSLLGFAVLEPLVDDRSIWW